MRYPAESYTREECLAVLTACGTSWTGQRNRALITVLWRCGLRLGEALALLRYDIDFTAKTIRVRHGKGDRARTVGFDEKTAVTLERYDRSGRIEGKGVPFFATQDGKPIYQSYIRALMPRLAHKANVEKRIHAHGFRHTFAVDLAREGVPMPLIQRLLGHASLGTTSIYLASLSPEEALDAVRGRDW